MNPSLLLAIPLLPLVAAIIAGQVAVRAKDRVRVVKMPAETKQ